MTAPLPPMSRGVQQVFARCTPQAQAGLHHLRALIFTTAAAHPRIGRIVEDLRWGQPSYLTPDTMAACSLRIGSHRKGGFALFVHCKTSLIADFVAGPGAMQRTEGTRAVLFGTVADIADGPVTLLIAAALTYHQRPKP